MLIRIVLAGLFLSALVAAQTPAGKPYPIDVNHSTVGFSVPIMGGLSKVSGKFTDFAITLNNDEQDITKSSVSVVIKSASINTGIPARDKHLSTADFFDVEKYPEITFNSTRIEKKGKQLIAVGPLTMHGVTKEIALSFTVIGPNVDQASKKMNLGYSAHLTLDRKDFGINWEHKQVANFVGDNVEIEISLITRALDAK